MMSQFGSAVDAVERSDEGEGKSLLDTFVDIKEEKPLDRTLLKTVLGTAKVEKNEAEPARYRSIKDDTWAEFVENVEDYRPGGLYPVDIGDTLLSKYKVCQKLGHGRHATVWLCRNTVEPEWRVMKIFKASCTKRAEESYDIALHAMQKITEPVPSRMIRIPDRIERMESANGKHICFVLSLHGPKITHHDLKEPVVMTRYLQRVLLCLRALNKADIGHGGIHPGNILYDVDDSVYQYSEEDMLKCLGKPTRHRIRIEAAESRGKEFAKAHAPKYLTAPTQGLGRMKLLSSIALTDVAVAIVLDDELRSKHMSKQQKTHADLWGFCFTTIRMGQRKKLNALPWQPITKRRNPETHRERLVNLMAPVFKLCDDILYKKDNNKAWSLDQTHGVDPASIEKLNQEAQLNLMLQRAVEHLWEDPRDVWLFGDLIDETRNFRIRDPPLFKEGSEDDDHDDEEEGEDPDTQVKPGETANEYNTLTGSVKPLAQSPLRGDRAFSRFRDGEVQGKPGPKKSTKKSVTPEKKSKEKVEEKKSKEKKPEEKNVVKSKEKPKENPNVKSEEKSVEKSQQKSKERSTPKPKEKSKEKSSENPKRGEKPEEDEADEIRTVPVHLPKKDETSSLFNGKSSSLFGKTEEQEEPQASASSAQTEDHSSVQPKPEPESKPDSEPEEEHEKKPEPESRPRDKSTKVRREAFQYVVLGLIVMFAFLTVVFATLFFWARPSPAVAGPALKNAGELLYMQSRRLSPQTTFFEGVLTSSGAEGSTRDADARALFQGLGFLESEFKTLSE
ncbi:hypothetical protein KJ359_004217 [Pestalotiopsis sp. 9143b]|nr:hypothetical protein KJ359_004217 [Pestalotiopsis sp. 9143b]